LVEKNREQTEERAFALIEARTLAERDQALMISALQYKAVIPVPILDVDDDDDKENDKEPPSNKATPTTPTTPNPNPDPNPNPNPIVCQYIGDHLPDFQYLNSNFVESQKLPPRTDAEKLTLLKVYKTFNQTLTTNFEKFTLANSDRQEEKMLRLYMCCSIEDATKVLTHGFSGGIGGYKEIVLFADPLLATRLANTKIRAAAVSDPEKGEQKTEIEFEAATARMAAVSAPLRDQTQTQTQTQTETQTQGEESSIEEPKPSPKPSPKPTFEDEKFAAFFVIQVRVALKLFSTVALDEEPTAIIDINQLGSRIPKSAEALKVTYPIVNHRSAEVVGGKNDDDDEEEDDDDEEEREEERLAALRQAINQKGQFYCVQAKSAVQILPEYHFLCTGSHLKSEIRRVEKILEEMKMMTIDGKIAGEVGNGADKNSDMQQLESKIDNLIEKYGEAVWEELSPETAEQLRHLDKDMRHREEVVGKGREAIDGERENQENILREFRAALAAKGGGGGGGGGGAARGATGDAYGVGAGAMQMGFGNRNPTTEQYYGR